MLKSIKSLLTHKVLRAIAVFYTLGLTVASLVPVSTLLKKSSLNDKYLHIITYTVFTLLWYVALYKEKLVTLKKLTTVVFFSLLFGIIIEVLQVLLTSYRSFDVLDVAANGLGTVIAVMLLIVNATLITR